MIDLGIALVGTIVTAIAMFLAGYAIGLNSNANREKSEHED